ncbi:putative ABC transport system permease protein [Flavobacterium aquidurense]|uniref:Multidrug ABC transporter substrate-binding protein n=1 Tax=Flavobacterium frigidimaris TaxID=262320 RepID=A0ABX4BNJ4_FLAFR|nr:ABC transporter permease [Flavobacterium frigidimaris]OXA78001.1 multidrug ABC transporter substrate-binding protein [Flavobacterium frigidimaris]SDZ61846.1 putative ABC transport system permease protein [Flavobacterium aquidurense]
MIFNWFKIFIYHLKQSKLFSFLNVLGLSIGVAGVIFAILYWNNENAYDQWNPEKENVYEVLNKFGTNADIWNSSPVPFGLTCKATIPEIESITFFTGWYSEDVIKHENQKWIGKKIIVADYDFFDSFPFPILKGAKKDILKEKNSVAISDKTAKLIFKNEDPIGKIITKDNKPYIVKTVYKIMSPSSVEPDYVFGGLINEDDLKQWGNFNYTLMVKTKKGASKELVLKKMQHVNFVNRTVKEAKDKGVTPEQFVKENGEILIIIDQLATARLHGTKSPNGANFPEGRGNLQLLYIVVGLSILILTLSLVNYINLATASAIKRAKEVGVRKIVGASKKQIIAQFIFETAIIVVLAIIFALAIVELSLPYYNNFLKKSLTMNGGEFYLQLIFIFGLVIVLAGIFPAIYISNFETLKVLKGNFARSKSGIWIRNSMLIFQFGIAAFFIIGALIVNSQVSYMMNKDLGFSGDQVIRVPFRFTDQAKKGEKYRTAKQEILKFTGVQDVSTFAGSFGNGSTSSSGFTYNGVFVQPRNIEMDYGFLDMMKIKIVKGRDLSPKYASDTVSNWLINEALAKKIGLKNPINTIISSGWGNEKGNMKFKVVGVVKDFHITGLQSEVPPMIFVTMKTLKWNNFENVYIKVSPNNLTETLAKLKTYWEKNINPDYPFDYEFVNKGFAKTYEEQVKQKDLFFILNLVVIIIAIFGLFALASFSMERRLKEIAIRKTLGAETDILLKELSKQYIVFCLIGFAIGIMPAYILLQKWLENFAFRIDVSVVPFTVALVSLLILTLMIVLAKAYQVTKIDILKYLKYE